MTTAEKTALDAAVAYVAASQGAANDDPKITRRHVNDSYRALVAAVGALPKTGAKS